MSKRKFSEYVQEIVNCWSDENSCKPEDVNYGCYKKYKFDCDKCLHSFWKAPCTITGMGSWCAFCSNKAICGEIDCSKCFQLSFQFHAPEKSQYWSRLNQKLPHQVFKGCSKKYLFDCDKCPHSFWKSPSTITVPGGSWCGLCNNKTLCGRDECITCYEKTFAFKHPERLPNWSSKNTLLPNQVFLGTSVKYLFDCEKCGHEIKLSPNDISGGNKWCGFCANKALCGTEDCMICYEKTFAYHEKEKSLCWSSKNEKKPHQVFRYSNKKYFFDCETCEREFEMIIENITQNRSWCPTCSPCSKSEEAIKTKLATLENVKTEKEETIYLNNRALRWDFVVTIGLNKFYLETDGKQHFHLKNYMGISRTKDPIKGLEKFRDQRVRDHLKEDYIRRTNKLLFRVSYRQLKQMGTLVDKMISESESGRTGVVYMDSIYNDWEPIP